MCLHGTPRHLELAGDLGVVASLQQQLDNLLFPWTQPNGGLFHQTSPSGVGSSSPRTRGWALPTFIASTMPL